MFSIQLFPQTVAALLWAVSASPWASEALGVELLQPMAGQG